MGGIKTAGALTGMVAAKSSLSGELSSERGLSGKLTISIGKEYEAYSGEYEITPQAFNPQILDTSNKVMTNDIVVNEVPYFETGNSAEGVTAYIGKEAR